MKSGPSKSNSKTTIGKVKPDHPNPKLQPQDLGKAQSNLDKKARSSSDLAEDS